MAPSRCSDCAFTPGTSASKSAHTVFKAQLCVLARDPFFCHEEVEAEMVDGEPVYRQKEGTQPRACAGWVEAVAAAGAQPDWRVSLAAEFLKLLEIAEDGGEEWDEDRSLAEIHAALGRVDAAVRKEPA
jgi:hypothetical protein